MSFSLGWLSLLPDLNFSSLAMYSFQVSMQTGALVATNLLKQQLQQTLYSASFIFSISSRFSIAISLSIRPLRALYNSAKSRAMRMLNSARNRCSLQRYRPMRKMMSVKAAARRMRFIRVNESLTGSLVVPSEFRRWRQSLQGCWNLRISMASSCDTQRGSGMHSISPSICSGERASSNMKLWARKSHLSWVSTSESFLAERVSLGRSPVWARKTICLILVSMSTLAARQWETGSVDCSGKGIRILFLKLYQERKRSRHETLNYHKESKIQQDNKEKRIRSL